MVLRNHRPTIDASHGVGMVGGVKALYAVLLALVLGVGCGKTSNEAANKLFVEATKQMAEAVSKDDNEDMDGAIADYEKVLVKVRKIVSDYPESDIAVKLVSGETLFTGKSLEEIEERVKELKIRVDYNRFDHIIQQAADLYRFPPAIIKAVIWRESRFNPDARGMSGEYGLMQIKGTAAHEWALAGGVTGFRTEHLLNPKTNIRAGSWYLKKWSSRAPHADNPFPFALAVYNAGPSKAREWAKDTNSSAEFIEQIDYPATRDYVQAILKKHVEFQKMLEK